MKIAVECHSPLLQKSLELFLSKYLVTSKKSDIVVRDEVCLDDKRCFYIASDPKADLQKPFSKSQLILALQKHYNKLYKNEICDEKKPSDELNSSTQRFMLLEKKIELLTQEYQKNVLQAIREVYEK